MSDIYIYACICIHWYAYIYKMHLNKSKAIWNRIIYSWCLRGLATGNSFRIPTAVFLCSTGYIVEVKKRGVNTMYGLIMVHNGIWWHIMKQNTLIYHYVLLYTNHIHVQGKSLQRNHIRNNKSWQWATSPNRCNRPHHMVPVMLRPSDSNAKVISNLLLHL